jgi:RimJ/RimL family protein N-acetyltransferase
MAPVLYELKPPEYPNVRPLLQSLGYHLAIYGILDGSVPARVFVDHPASPKSAFVWAKHLFLAGSGENQAFNRSVAELLEKEIYPQARRPGLSVFYDPKGWSRGLAVILKDKYPVPVQREYYVLKQALNKDWRSELPSDFQMKDVNKELLTKTSLSGLEDLKEELCSERESIEDFLEKSFGVCLTHEDHLVGWCLSEYNTSSSCEVGIATAEMYRRRGFATLMTCAFIEKAREHGVTNIGWHCFADNLPSVRTAIKAGFMKAKDYPALFIWIRRADAFADHGNLEYARGNFPSALEWYGRAMEEGEVWNWVYFRAGCSAAQLGEIENAFQLLNKAVEKRFKDRDAFEKSSDLDMLRNLEDWKALMDLLDQPGKIENQVP